MGTVPNVPRFPVAVLNKELNQRIEQSTEEAGQKDYFDGADFPDIGGYECKNK